MKRGDSVRRIPSFKFASFAIDRYQLLLVDAESPILTVSGRKEFNPRGR